MSEPGEAISCLRCGEPVLKLVAGHASRLQEENDRLRDALERIKAIQPRTLVSLRYRGTVFARAPLGRPSMTNEEEWEQVAFNIYTDLCEVEGIASAALQKTSEFERSLGGDQPV